MKLVYALVGSIFLNISCSSDDPKPSNETELGLFTGMILRPSERGPSILLGNPNILVDQTLMFPNPVSASIVIRDYSNAEITNVWFLKVTPQKKYQTVDFNGILNSKLYTDSEVESNADLVLKNLKASNLTINLKDLSFGYYRVFLKVGGKIQWNNIYIGKDTSIDEFRSFWK